MTEKICTNCKQDGDEKWLPTPIYKLESYFGKFIVQGKGVVNIKSIKKNLAYNIQYLQFICKTLSEFKVTSVIVTQSWKVFIIIGTGVVEALLYYLLKSTGNQRTNDWALDRIIKSNEWMENSARFRLETNIYKKLPSPIDEEMSLDMMIKKAESKKLLGQNHEIYKKLQFLRKLRNRVHLFLSETDNDTDWTHFNQSEFNTMRLVLYSFMTSSLFDPTEDEKIMFEFLKS